MLSHAFDPLLSNLFFFFFQPSQQNISKLEGRNLTYDEALKAKGLKRRSGRLGRTISTPEIDELPILNSYYRLLRRQNKNDEGEERGGKGVEKSKSHLSTEKEDKGKNMMMMGMMGMMMIEKDAKVEVAVSGRRKWMLVRQDASDAGDAEVDEFGGGAVDAEMSADKDYNGADNGADNGGDLGGDDGDDGFLEDDTDKDQDQHQDNLDFDEDGDVIMK